MLKWLKRIALLLLAMIVLGTATGWWLLHGSVPRLNGALALPGLSAAASVQRDASGVVTIDAANHADLARALGYVHAQERYFEMDLMRRSAAGELSELFGQVALPTDRQRRSHRMRARVDQHLAHFGGEHLPQLQAYTDGVNAGLADLRVRPWPYLVLRQPPRPWTLADSALTGYAMYFDLQDSQNTRELALWRIKSQLPAALFTLLAHDGSPWDAPLFGQARGNASLPGADQLDLRRLAMPANSHGRLADKGTPGSNNWAVAGSLTADGRAIVADDMHLGLRAPNIWFRARLRYPDARAAGGQVDVSGFTLPGLPAVIVGSNGHVAWGFTNSYADTADWYLTSPCTLHPTAAQPCDPVSRHQEIIGVADAAPETLRVEETHYGPVLHRQPGGKALALRWVAHLPGAINFRLADMAVARDLDAALAVAGQMATPAQNLVMGDASGRIAWRIAGPLPVRGRGCEAHGLVYTTAPQTRRRSAPLRPGALQPAAAATAPCPAWPISTTLSPILADPTYARLWTANARVADDAGLAVVGDGGYALGARAQQIRDGLMAKPRFDEHDLLAIQLDDRSLFLQRWWRLLQTEGQRDGGQALAALAEAGRQWPGRASVDSVGYRVVRAWRLAVHARIADGLTAPAQAALGEAFVMPDFPQLEAIVWPLLEQRPAHLLPRRFQSWDALLEDAAREVRDELAQQGPLPQRTWGERNTARICHPLANALPALLRPALCMPADPLPGDGAMPRVQGPAFGASQRMVVAPGREADGILHMPGGQSGNPLSPFWGAGHADWVQGKPSPFLPGPAEYTLRLQPR